MSGDSLVLFAQSLLIGLSIAAPVGPIGLLVIQRTLQRGRAVGLATGLGAHGLVVSPALMVAGVLLGSALWWLILSAVVAALRRRFDERWQRRVNRLSATLLAGLALWTTAALLL